VLSSMHCVNDEQTKKFDLCRIDSFCIFWRVLYPSGNQFKTTYQITW